MEHMRESKNSYIGTRYHCKDDKERKGENRPKKVFICSPFAPRGETREEMQKDMERNIRAAQRACRFAALEGNVPYAPHLFFTQFLDDGDSLEREYGQVMGLSWLRQCDEIRVIGRRISPGMRREIKKAREWGIPVKKYVFKRSPDVRTLDALFEPNTEFIEMDV